MIFLSNLHQERCILFIEVAKRLQILRAAISVRLPPPPLRLVPKTSNNTTAEYSHKCTHKSLCLTLVYTSSPLGIATRRCTLQLFFENTMERCINYVEES
jgi:hypothetical protein